MAAAGHPHALDWIDTPSRALVLRREARASRYDNDLPWTISVRNWPETDAERVRVAVNLLLGDGQTEGDHHKAWVIDQVLRVLTGDNYQQVIKDYCMGEDGPDTYSWDEGIAP
jgi:hypothetical protein